MLLALPTHFALQDSADSLFFVAAIESKLVLGGIPYVAVVVFSRFAAFGTRCSRDFGWRAEAGPSCAREWVDESAHIRGEIAAAVAEAYSDFAYFIRTQQLLLASEKLRKANEEMHRFWFANPASTLSYDRLNGYVGPERVPESAPQPTMPALQDIPADGPHPILRPTAPASDMKMPAGAEQSPQPAIVAPFGPNMIRMPRLAEPEPGYRGLGSIPRPVAEELKDSNQFISPSIDPSSTLDIIEGRKRLVILKGTPKAVRVGDESILNQNLFNPRQLILFGCKIGKTTLSLEIADANDKSEVTIRQYDVRVLPQPSKIDDLSSVCQALKSHLNKTFHGSSVVLKQIGDKVVVDGKAKE